MKVSNDNSRLEVEFVHSLRGNPDPPEVHYIIATTCPFSCTTTPAKAAKYRWIKVCFLEDLIAAKILPKEMKQNILEAQAESAGGPAASR